MESGNEPNRITDLGDFVRQSPLLGTLFVLSFVNWFLFFAVSMYLHGDALGTYPSHDGFAVKSHGRITPVSESVWEFSLFYSAATLLLTPAIQIAGAARIFWGQWRRGKWVTRLFGFALVAVWCLGWYSSIGSSVLQSLEDWRTLKAQPRSLYPRASIRTAMTAASSSDAATTARLCHGSTSACAKNP